MVSHGQCLGTYFQGWMPSSQFLGQDSLDSIDCGQLILRKIIKIAATGCEILRLKSTEFDFHWVLRPRSRWQSLQRPPSPLAGFKGLNF